MNSLGIYLHVPFCKSKCYYCDFNSYSGRESCIALYFDALGTELSVRAKELTDRVCDTIYFGGGTPSYIDTEILGNTLRQLKAEFNISKDCEITVECNPGTIDKDGLKFLKEVGVNRLSIGLQSTEDRLLKKLGRIHTLSDFETCYYSAREVGFDNISLDLMYGLPEMDMEIWKDTLKRVVELNPEHISAYALKIEEGTPFSEMKLNLPDEDLCADMYDLAVEVLRKAGYIRYEVSNFAKPYKESRHNQKYWECNDFLGLGAGAYSCINSTRFSNYTDVDLYIQEICHSKSAIAESNFIEDTERMSEFVFLGLRIEKGISLTEFENRFGKSFEEVYGKASKKYIDWGFLVEESGRLRLSDKGFFVSNTILADFV